MCQYKKVKTNMMKYVIQLKKAIQKSSDFFTYYLKFNDKVTSHLCKPLRNYSIFNYMRCTCKLAKTKQEIN